METQMQLAWMLLVFMLLVGFLNNSPVGEAPFVWGPSMILTVPFDLAGAFMSSFPLLAPLIFLAFIYYFHVLVGGALGEGLTMFVIASVIIVLVGG